MSRRPVLVVSPHYDDALLSAFHLATAPEATVLTVCAAGPSPAVVTEWDTRCGFADSERAMTARALEDDAAFDGLDARREHLDLVEAQYLSGPRVEADADRLAAFVGDWLDQHGGIVAVPVGAGRPLTALHWLRFHIPVRGLGMPGGAAPHPDHIWVTDTILERFSEAPLLLYEDLPYAWARRGDRRAAQLAQRVQRPVSRADTPVSGRHQAERVAAYRSQVPGIVAGWVRDLATVLPPVETTWFLAPTA